MACLIELECQWSALRAARDLELAKTKAKAQEAAIEATIEAKAKDRFSIEEAKLEAELKLLKLSERCSSVASKSALRRVRSIKGSNKGSGIGAVPHISFSVNRIVKSSMTVELQHWDQLRQNNDLSIRISIQACCTNFTVDQPRLTLGPPSQ